MASDIWSQILSGWPSPTDSGFSRPRWMGPEVKRKVSSAVILLNGTNDRLRNPEEGVSKKTQRRTLGVSFLDWNRICGGVA